MVDGAVWALGAGAFVAAFAASASFRNRVVQAERAGDADRARTARKRLLWFRIGLGVFSVSSVVGGYILSHP